MRLTITAPLIAVVIYFLTGCGQTGPLYMPKEETPKPPKAAVIERSNPLDQDVLNGERHNELFHLSRGHPAR